MHSLHNTLRVLIDVQRLSRSESKRFGSRISDQIVGRGLVRRQNTGWVGSGHSTDICMPTKLQYASLSLSHQNALPLPLLNTLQCPCRPTFCNSPSNLSYAHWFHPSFSFQISQNIVFNLFSFEFVSFCVQLKSI